MNYRARKSLLLFLVLAVVCLPQFAIAGSNWPQFQYNAQHIGVNPSATLKPPFELLWADTLCLSQLAQPTIASDRIYVTIKDNFINDEEASIWCLKLNDGSLEWTKSYGLLPQQICQPSFAYNTLFVQLTSGWDTLYAVTPDSGKKKWCSSFRAQSNYGLAPTVYEGKIIVCGDFYGGMTCFNAYSGGWLWKRDLNQVYEWTPVIYDGEVFTHESGVFSIFDLDTGERLFQYQPLLDTLLTTKGYIWDTGNSPVLDTTTGIIYLVTNTSITAMDISKRERIWEVRDTCCHRITPAILDGKLYSIEQERLTVRNGSTGEILDEFFPSEPFVWLDCTEPTIANGYLFLSSINKVYVLDLETMKEVWTYEKGGHVIPVGDRLILATRNGEVFCFGSIATDVDDESDLALPDQSILHQNHPNPFNSSTLLSFDLDRRSFVELSIYNVLGRKVRTLITDEKPAGSHSVEWNGSDNTGKSVSSGIYLYRLETNASIQVNKMMFLK